MNNSVYGKQIENVRKRVNIKLEDEEGAEKLVAKPNYKNIVNLDESDNYLVEMDSVKQANLWRFGYIRLFKNYHV